LWRTPAGRWVALENYDKIHNCRIASNRNQPVNRPSKSSTLLKGDVFKDITFPTEFILKTEIGRNQRRSKRLTTPAQSPENRGVKRQSPPRMQAEALKTQRDSGKSSNGRFLLFSLVVLLALFLLWSRWNM